jgi:hypothetical protein
MVNLPIIPADPHSFNSKVLSIYLACFWFIVERQQAVRAESEREY